MKSYAKEIGILESHLAMKKTLTRWWRNSGWSSSLFLATPSPFNSPSNSLPLHKFIPPLFRVSLLRVQCYAWAVETKNPSATSQLLLFVARSHHHWIERESGRNRDFPCKRFEKGKKKKSHDNEGEKAQSKTSAIRTEIPCSECKLCKPTPSEIYFFIFKKGNKTIKLKRL